MSGLRTQSALTCIEYCWDLPECSNAFPDLPNFEWNVRQASDLEKPSKHSGQLCSGLSALAPCRNYQLTRSRSRPTSDFSIDEWGSTGVLWEKPLPHNMALPFYLMCFSLLPMQVTGNFDIKTWRRFFEVRSRSGRTACQHNMAWMRDMGVMVNAPKSEQILPSKVSTCLEE